LMSPDYPRAAAPPQGGRGDAAAMNPSVADAI